MAMVVKVDLHHEDQKRLRHREAGFCRFVREHGQGYLVKLLKGKSSPMEDALLETWKGQFENVADHTDDAKTLFFVELMHANFTIDLKIGEENEKIEGFAGSFYFCMACCALLTVRKAWLWMEVCWLICVVLVAWRMMNGGSPYMLCWRVPANWKISFYWAWVTKWKIFYAEGHAYLRELTDKPKVLPRWSACRTGLCILSANFLTSYSAVGFNRLSAERSVGIRNGWTLWRSTDMFDAFCLSYWYVDRWYPDMIWHVWCRECF